MANSEKLPKKMSVEEYLLFEETSPIRHEYLDGRIYAMTGGTKAHSGITSNIVTILRNHLKGGPCRVYSNSLKVRVDAINSFFYPDVLVDCGPYKKDDLFTKSPAVIFEVLSNSTASTDRREKLHAYQRITSLYTYVLVTQTMRRLEIYRKQDDDNWIVERFGAHETFEVVLDTNRSISFSVDEVYEDTDVDESPNFQVRENAEVYVY